MRQSFGLTRKSPLRRSRKRSRELAIWKSYGHCCVGCGRSGVPAENTGKGRFDCIDPHHVVKRSRGGSDEADNIVALCGKCHAEFHGAEQHPRGQIHGLAEWVKSHAPNFRFHAFKEPPPFLAIDPERREQVKERLL